MSKLVSPISISFFFKIIDIEFFFTNSIKIGSIWSIKSLVKFIFLLFNNLTFLFFSELKLLTFT